METLLIILISLVLIFASILALSIFILNNMKGSKIYFFVKDHIITDEDLEK